jgi:hypothetical protein
MDLYQITDQLERKEAYANRYDDVQGGPRSLQTYGTEQLGYRLSKEIQVLEVEQQTDSQGYAKGRQV